MSIQLPAGFTNDHRAVTHRFVQGDVRSYAERKLMFEAFDLLRRAKVETDKGWETFAAVHERLIAASFAENYLRTLQSAPNIAVAAEPLRAQVSRQIIPVLRAAGLVKAEDPLSFYLVAFSLYWWYAFARGYAFELEVFHDLSETGIEFQAHDILDPVSRRSPFDLVVLGFRGDIKTSTYFLHAARTRGVEHDFYITRLFDSAGRERKWVVLLKEAAWRAINGEAMPAALDDLASALPGVFRIWQEDMPLIVLDYETWKVRVRQRQKERRL